MYVVADLPLKCLRHHSSFPHKMDAPDRHNEQSDASLCPSVRSFIRLLDGIWHLIYYIK